MKKKHDYCYVISAWILALSAVMLFLPAHTVFCIRSIVVLMLLYEILYVKNHGIDVFIHLLVACIVVCGILASFFLSVLSLSCFSLLAFVFGSVVLVLKLKETALVWSRPFADEKWLYLFRCVKGILIGVCFALGMFLLWNPDALSKRLAYIPQTKQWVPDSASETEIFRDVRYGETYENSVMDIYTGSQTDQGIVVWLHGGNYSGGDKAADDNSLEMFQNALNSGYAVVSMNYALTPESRYPIPLLQLDECLSYLSETGKDYHLNSDRVVLAGSGSGAQIIAQYATMCTSSAYQEQLGISCSFAKENLIGMYLVSGIYQPQYGAETGFFLTDYTMDAQLRTYFSTKALLNQTPALTADILPYMNSEFPPVLFGEGNFGTYTKQAYRFLERLEEIGVDHEAYVFDTARGSRHAVGLSFDVEYNTSADAMHGRFITFLNELKK